MDNETTSWEKDETFKMRLEFDNTLLKKGMELYGFLLAGILICGLTTVLVPAMGKIIDKSIFTI